MNHLADKLNNIPITSGCYLFKNDKDQVIYVGKALNLKKRVGSYFSKQNHGIKTKCLLRHIHSLDFILTENDIDALILENTLIKKYNPLFNIRLKSDKSYPYILIDYKENFPRPTIVRRPSLGKNKEIFGPYPDGTNIWKLNKTLIYSIGLRDCSLSEFNRRKFPCLLYQMEKCTASCVKYIEKEQYLDLLALYKGYLVGNTDPLMDFLHNKMIQKGEKEEFEAAAIIRDQIQDLQILSHKSVSHSAEFLSHKAKDWDMWCIVEDSLYLSCVLKQVRDFKFIGQHHWCMEKSLFSDLSSLILHYYDSSEKIEDVIIYIAENISSIINKKIELIPQELEQFYQLGGQQALEYLEQESTLHREFIQAMDSLGKLLNLDSSILNLEAIDVAVFQGKSPCASTVRLESGIFNKKKFRYYTLDERPEGNNDFAMLQEVFARRLKSSDWPEVFIIDGGRPQLQALSKLIVDNKLSNRVVGIAKQRKADGKSIEERLVFFNRKEYFVLSQERHLEKFICSARDQAHRFCRKLHHQHEKKRFFNE